ncbi:hypothetical protein F5887DRAFT_919934 [Amanita rubescens]|nr:hypothetical protein F5887DRAFT_919934 [Amanita rubescens]
MRLVTFTLAFFVFGATFVTPINAVHHDPEITSTSTAVQEYSSRSSLSNSMSTAGGTTQVIRKRATKEQLIVALRSIIPNPVRYEKSGIVYHLRDQIDGLPAAVKIIYTGRQGVTTVKVRSERSHLQNVNLLHGCALSGPKGTQYYYLIMPYMGVPFGSLTENLSQERAYVLMNEAQTREPNLKKTVFRKDIGGNWIAELVNWESARAVTSEECTGRIEKPEKLINIQNDPDIFRPPPETFEYDRSVI